MCYPFKVYNLSKKKNLSKRKPFYRIARLGRGRSRLRLGAFAFASLGSAYARRPERACFCFGMLRGLCRGRGVRCYSLLQISRKPDACIAYRRGNYAFADTCRFAFCRGRLRFYFFCVIGCDCFCFFLRGFVCLVQNKRKQKTQYEKSNEAQINYTLDFCSRLW